MTTDEQYQQISLMDDASVISLYATAAKVLQDRGKLALTKAELKKLANNRTRKHSNQIFNTPHVHTQRGKLKRQSHHSILIDFLNEDWGVLFEGEYDVSPIYYVYYHSSNEKGNMRFKKDSESVEFKGRPFYIGKGVESRYKNKKRSRAHLSIINHLIARGNKEDDIFHIFKDGLTEKQALELEAKLITFFGTSAELDSKKTHFTGMKGGMLVNADPAKRPKDVSKMMRIKGQEE